MRSTINGLFGKARNFLIQRMFNQRSIQYKLLSTYILVNLIPLIIVGAISYKVSSEAIIEEVKRSDAQLLDEISRNFNSYVHAIEINSNIFVSRLIDNNIKLDENNNFSDVKVMENMKRISEFIQDTFRSSNDYESIRVYSNEGEFVTAGIPENTYKLYSYKSEGEIAWQNKMFENRTDRLIYDVHTLEVNGMLSFVASRPVIHPYTGERYGYISFDKKFSSFAELFKRFEYRKGSIIQAISKNGTILYHTDWTKIGSKADPEWMKLITGTNSRYSVSYMNKQKMLNTSSHSVYGEMLIVGSTPISLMYKMVNPLRNVTVIVCIVSLLLVVILSLFLSIYISRPIKQLKSLFHSVERGNFNVQIQEPVSRDEIGQLRKSFNSMVTTMKQLIQDRYVNELHRRNVELKALLMQINPHFMYNTLEVISGIADEEGVHKISQITQSLSKLLRYNIDLKKEKVTIQEEYDSCRHFFYILQSRFEDNLITISELDEAAKDYMIIKMILQPLVENAVKHGIEKKIGTGRIHLSIKKRQNRIQFVLSDNGIGFSKEKLQEFEQFKRLPIMVMEETSRSLGLKNVYTRLKIVFGDELHFHIDTIEGEGSTITIDIPAVKA
ncbi:cache domain-containing sensor histidine kinase [Cohnella thermotolerans]|jgi:two-component system sensor histidine kinase YesM|uniref:cache domain-containing sensor histidine kinase n=1 Tax=Cohnella thermotolerans TaxID=329858 RepID=UPI000478EFB2|nr:sensor histidine kinase [Cohnella thermotolerans]